MPLGINPLRWLVAVTAQVGPVFKGNLNKGLLIPTRTGAGGYTHAPDNATPLPLITNAAVDVCPVANPLSTTAEADVRCVTTAGPLVTVQSDVSAVATDIDYVCFGLAVD